jgi:hypothetical protein
MLYEVFTSERIFTEINTEEAARELIWRCRFGGKDFKCPHCACESFYQHKSRAEIRECRGCNRQIRVRAGTIFDSSKTNLLLWCKAIFHVMQGKRGISATELQRHLGLKSYGRVWTMLQKIRSALRQRDEGYQVGDGVVELDGAVFGKRETGNQCEVLVAIESKDWVDKNGKPKSKAGFAKVLVAKETKANAQKLLDQGVKEGAMVNTDGKFKTLKRVDHDYQVVSGNPQVCQRWLPWVHKFISNAKSWINGTHHGVRDKHIERYLGEYTYRFNRRHDVNSLFHRALSACAVAQPVRLHALC